MCGDKKLLSDFIFTIFLSDFHVRLYWPHSAIWELFQSAGFSGVVHIRCLFVSLKY